MYQCKYIFLRRSIKLDCSVREAYNSSNDYVNGSVDSVNFLSLRKRAQTRADTFPRDYPFFPELVRKLHQKVVEERIIMKHCALFMVVLLAVILCASAAPKQEKKPAGKEAKGAKAPSGRSGLARSLPREKNETKPSGSDHEAHPLPEGLDPTIPFNIKDEDVKGVQDSIVESMNSIQESLISFISGLFDTVKSLVQQSSGKAADLIQDSINRTNAVNTKVMSWGTEISDTFSQSLKNVSKLGENVLSSVSMKHEPPKDKKDKKDKKH